MKTKKPILMNQGHTDEVLTPECAINPLLPFLNKKWLVWECAWGQGSLAKHLKNKGFKVFGNGNNDFLDKDLFITQFDCIITNPPYSLKYEFLKRAYEYGKPFAFLLPLTALEGKARGELYRKYGIQLIIPNKRINFIMPNKQGGSWFQTAWFCYKLNLPKDLMFVDLKQKIKGEDENGK